VIPEPNREVVEALTANGTFVVGDPDDCARAVQKWADIGIDQLCFSPTTNTLPVEKVIESLHTFGKHVIPQFDKDEVHRTTRQREEWLAKNGA
jgi:alkanesulfonate monooxygenase SsuD/methylene tetrahydromethanopterin reductase-like flavin-dependent oxidoreductase (luciferase family)